MSEEAIQSIRRKQAMPRKFSTTLLLILIALFALPAQADVMANPCNCSTEAQWLSQAQSYGWGYRGYLYSFSSRQIRKFQNAGQIERVEPPKGTETSTSRSDTSSATIDAGDNSNVTWLPVEQRYQDYFDNLLAVRDYFGMPISKIVVQYNLPPTATGNNGAPIGTYDAYSILTHPSNNVNLADYLSEQRSQIFSQTVPGEIVNDLVSLLQSLDKAITRGELLNVTIVVHFPDGSRMTYVDTGGNRPDRVEQSGIDANNNPVLEDNTIHGRGDYDMTPGEIGGWLENMHQLGIPVVDGSVHHLSYSCTWDSGTNTITCHILNE